MLRSASLYVKCDSIQHSYELQSIELKRSIFSFPEGEIEYFPSSKGEIVIYCIVIYEKYKNTGIWSTFIKQLISNPNIDRICVCGLSNHIIEYSTAKNYIDNNYWINQGGDFIWERNINNKTRYTGGLVTPELIAKSKFNMFVFNMSA